MTQATEQKKIIQLLQKQNNLLEKIAKATAETSENSSETKDNTAVSAGWIGLGIATSWLITLYIATYLTTIIAFIGETIPDFIKPAIPFMSNERVVVDSSKVSEILRIANNYIGKDFAPGEIAQCAYFVRAVLEEADLHVGVTSSPIDGYLPTSEGFANSFFGSDLGTLIVDEKQLHPGDLVAFSNTYGDYSEGTITHVGLYTGNGMMIDRPTAAKPVKKRSISEYTFAGGVRLNAIAIYDMAAGNSFGGVSTKGSEGLEAISQRLQSKYGIPAAFTIAVGLHESGNGSAAIGEDNWFGVKASSGSISTSTHGTTEWYGGTETAISDDFCSSGCADSFARTVTNILKEQGKIPKGMSPEAIADAVGSIYATDPQWAEKVKLHLN